MLWKGGIVLLCLSLFACAHLEGPRWALLGDTTDKAYYMDRESVHRLANGTYRFPVKIRRYQEDTPHSFNDDHETDQVLFIETNCDNKLWVEAERGTMNQNGKMLFRMLNTSQSSTVIEPGTFQAAAYNYLCRNEPIVAFHNH